MNLKGHFSRFLDAAPGRLHFAAHSHHLWPDVTLEAQGACWQDAAALADRKWDKVFGEIYPAAQSGIARILGLASGAGIAFGPNTHGFLLRLLSALPRECSLKVLTTDGEFHSLERQLRRLEEDSLAEVTRVATEPFADFSDRFAAQSAKGGHDFVYFSQVFYNSGYAVPNLGKLVEAVAETDTLVVVDGYHGFLAMPTDLAPIQDRAFYLSGGYKYAMAGEGVAFLHGPEGYAERPRDTGWFAAFETLEQGAGARVTYRPGGARFLGATFDPVGIYRLRAVLDWLKSIDVTVEMIHERVQTLQARFVESLRHLGLEALRPDQLLVPVEEPNRGHFLSFRTDAARPIHRRLLEEDVITDYRGDRLRFGFGVYQDEEDLERLCHTLRRVLG